MISPDSRTRKWIDQCRKNLDPELAEKMILAFMTLLQKPDHQQPNTHF